MKEFSTRNYFRKKQEIITVKTIKCDVKKCKDKMFKKIQNFMKSMGLQMSQFH